MPQMRRPGWLKAPFPAGPGYSELKGLVGELRLHTVCESARCPNIGECWNQRTATFMLLGNTCTRACGFCNIATGRPEPVDEDEPARVAAAVEYLGLRYAVLTSVNRDDQPDGGAHIFAETLRLIRERVPACRVEVLIPDFKGDAAALLQVLDARPAVLNHNVETVPRLFRYVQRQAKFDWTLDLFRRAAAHSPELPLKTGFMVGHGETMDECLDLMRELRGVGVSLLTIGQYLRPTPEHLPVKQYWTPDEFAALTREGLALGFAHVEAGALVRSSYHAREQEAAAAGRVEPLDVTRANQPPDAVVEMSRRRGLHLLPVIDGGAG